MSKWEWKKLKDICEIEFGTRVVRKKDGGSIYPVYGGGGATFKMDSFNREDCLIVSRFAMSPQCTRIVKGKFFLNDSGLSLKSKDLSVLSEQYLNSIILGINDDIYALGRGAAQRNLNVEAFKELNIPIPPLSEQKRIVKFLDEEFSKIETLKTNAETNLKNAKALYQKSLDKIIEDECRRYTLTSLKEITTKIGSGATPKGGKKSYQTEGISLIRSMNVLYGSFSYDNLAHINEKQAKALYGVAIQCADVLFNITGASIARCCVVPDDVIPARVNQHVSILRPIQKVLNSDYLSVVLLASQNQKKLLDIGEAGATRQALTKGDLEVFPIPLPPLSVQKEIVARLDKLSENVKRLEANYKQIIADCDELKKSILKKTFEGES